MRQRLVSMLDEIMQDDKRVVLLLAGVGAWQFRKLDRARVFDLGISEQAIIGIAGGLAKAGFIPVVFGIAPFLVERALEQIKLDIALPHLPVILITVGASYDYSTAGPTHHCPADVPILCNIPGMRVVVPGHPDEMASLLKQAIQAGGPAYFRLSAQGNAQAIPVELDKISVVRDGRAGDVAVFAVGPVLDRVSEATHDRDDVRIFYITTVNPLDARASLFCRHGRAALVVEPHYPYLPGAIAQIYSDPSVAIPRDFVHQTGPVSDIDADLELTSRAIRERIEAFYP